MVPPKPCSTMTAARRSPGLGLLALGGALAAVAFAVFLVPKAPLSGEIEALAPAEVVALAQSAQRLKIGRLVSNLRHRNDYKTLRRAKK